MGGLAIGSGGYYGEERIGANYNDDNIGDYDDDAGYGDGNGDDYDVTMMMMLLVWRLAIGSGGYYEEEWCR